ncbi:MAG TPA: porin family protein [Candidatus Pacearchaeota archaeon]|nr:porin family protein [Candidatus Pacearchaeota archaeon]
MKGLVKKLLTPLAVVGALSMSAPVSAQNNQGEFTAQSSLSGGVGMYQFAEERAKNIYGSSIPIFSVGFGREISPNFAIEGSLSYLKAAGKPIILAGQPDRTGAEIQLTSLELVGKYTFDGEGARVYIGGGVSYTSANESIGASYSGTAISAEGTVSAVGPLIVLGVDIPLNDDETSVLYGELSGRSIKIGTEIPGEVLPGAEKADIGGGALKAGIRFRF